METSMLGSYCDSDTEVDKALGKKQTSENLQRWYAGQEKPGREDQYILDAKRRNAADYYFIRKMYSRALRILDRGDAEEKSRALDTINNLAVILSEKRRYRKALQYHQRALDEKQKLFGNNHLDALKIMGDIAEIYVKQRCYDEALEWYRQVLGRKKETLGDRDPSTLFTFHRFATVLREKEQSRGINITSNEQPVSSAGESRDSDQSHDDDESQDDDKSHDVKSYDDDKAFRSLAMRGKALEIWRTDALCAIDDIAIATPTHQIIEPTYTSYDDGVASTKPGSKPSSIQDISASELCLHASFTIKDCREEVKRRVKFLEDKLSKESFGVLQKEKIWRLMKDPRFTPEDIAVEQLRRDFNYEEDEDEDGNSIVDSHPYKTMPDFVGTFKGDLLEENDWELPYC